MISGWYLDEISRPFGISGWFRLYVERPWGWVAMAGGPMDHCVDVLHATLARLGIAA